LAVFASDGFYAYLTATVGRIVLLIGLMTVAAHSEESLEYKIKAAYLYNFTKFITWPPIQNDTFNICLIGNDPFQGLLDNLETKTAQDKQIRIYRYENVKQANQCQIIYFDALNTHQSVGITNALLVGNLSEKLTVGSQPFFAESGGMIGFALEQEKVKLHINLKTLKQSGLSISAKLIEVSTVVEEDEHE
jgi:hypothetical protein